jgi:hypothetical protein
VPTASYRDFEPLLSSQVKGAYDLSGSPTSGDEKRSLIDVAVVNASGLLVGIVLGSD